MVTTGRCGKPASYRMSFWIGDPDEDPEFETTLLCPECCARYRHDMQTGQLASMVRDLVVETLDSTQSASGNGEGPAAQTW